MSDTTRNFFQRIMLQPAAVSGHVASVSIDSDSGQQQYATVDVGGQMIRVKLNVGSPTLANGDQVRLEQYGNAATAEYLLADVDGGRPSAGVYAIMNPDTALGGGTYQGGDLLVGKLAGGNVYVQYDTGRLFHRIGNEVYGIEYPDGSQLFGHAYLPNGGDWTPDRPNVYITANGIDLRNGTAASISMDTDGTIWAKQRITAGNGDSVGVLDGADSLWRIYAGSATPGLAPFRVDQTGNLYATKANITGAVTATSGSFTGTVYASDGSFAGEITASSGSITGNLLVSGSLRNADTGARYELDALGFKTYNNAGAQLTAILSDGSGWLGNQDVFRWNSDGVVEINGSAIIPGTIDLNDNTYNVPTITGLVITNNSPSAGYVAWNSFTIRHQGTDYTIGAGNSNARYLYWNKTTAPNALTASATIPNMAADQFMVIYNNGGVGIASLFSNFVYSDFISVATLSAISAKLGDIESGTITGATIRTAGSGARVQLNTTELAGYNSSDVKQFYASTADGKLYAGAGGVTLDANGVSLVSGTAYAAGSAIKIFYGTLNIGELYGYYYNGTQNKTALCAYGDTARQSRLELAAYTPNASYKSEFESMAYGSEYGAGKAAVYGTRTGTASTLSLDAYVGGASTPRTGASIYLNSAGYIYQTIAAAQKVSVYSYALMGGTPTEVASIDGSGNLVTDGSLNGASLSVTGNVDLGTQIHFTNTGDQTDAGKIVYKVFDTSAMCLVGAGTDGYHRKVRVYDLLQVGTVPYSSGSTFPTSPVTGQHFFHTGFNMLCVWNGTYWLSAHDYVVNKNLDYSGGSNSFSFGMTRDDVSRLYITRYQIRIWVTGVNDTGNYWNISLRFVNQGYSAATAFASWSTQTWASNANNFYSANPGSVSPVDQKSWLDISATRINTAGHFYIDCVIYYRLVLG